MDTVIFPRSLRGFGFLGWRCLDTEEMSLVPKRYPAEFRRRVLELLAEGRSVTEVVV